VELLKGVFDEIDFEQVNEISFDAAGSEKNIIAHWSLKNGWIFIALLSYGFLSC